MFVNMLRVVRLAKNGGKKHTSRFVLYTLKPIERIAIDTIGPLPNDVGFKYILVIVITDTFTQYVELYPKQEVTRQSPRQMLYGAIRAGSQLLWKS